MSSDPHPRTSMRDRLSSIHGQIAIALMLIAIGMSVATVNDYRAVQRLRESGVSAMGTVVRTEYSRYSSDDAIVRFTTRDGRHIRTRVDGSRWQGSPLIDDQRQVLYDPADPSGNVLDPQAGFMQIVNPRKAVVVLLAVPLAVLLWWQQADAFFWLSFWITKMKRRRGTADR
ncbi:DUF3592 domain-containing protein [Nonomuraea aurantiaca]|uniref:DUF3592 domain-containing protein n=1 Tax=Nonomuraea aurantiaca TaxID=2878562 RepID=UPI001CDA5282|nr:DUF3592 domain-containing protein [Nonomuraea aurantiaca]MCA2230429.1 DUF3592 domain-containing protein [Nonomuraea aurantiaca]